MPVTNPLRDIRLNGTSDEGTDDDARTADDRGEEEPSDADAALAARDTSAGGAFDGLVGAAVGEDAAAAGGDDDDALRARRVLLVRRARFLRRLEASLPLLFSSRAFFGVWKLLCRCCSPLASRRGALT